MNYKKHYDALIDRSKIRILGENEYNENHHIIPRCLGGNDNSENLVKLSPEEHYVAHQLLVKMYPDHKGLIWAALQMTGLPNGKRSNNKLYGWLRRKNQKVAKQRKGNKNGSYGRYWYHNPSTLDTIKCLPEEVPVGYNKGRRLKINTLCKKCNADTQTTYKVYCEKHQPNKPGTKKDRVDIWKCKNCQKEYSRKRCEIGEHSLYCSKKCKKDFLWKDKKEKIKKETVIQYTKFVDGNYTSLRDFCRKNALNPMTISKRFRMYIKEYTLLNK